MSSKMKYAVVNNTTVVDLTDDEFGASNYAIKVTPDALYLPLAKKTELYESKYATGKYIISDIRTAQLLEKIKVISSGYIYNTENYIIELINTWTLLDVANIDTLSSVSEPIKSELVNSVSVKSEPIKSEPVKSEPVNSESIKSEPVKSEPVKSEPVKSEPVKSEPVNSESIKSEPVKSEPVKSEPVNSVSAPLSTNPKMISTKIEKNEVEMLCPPPTVQLISTENSKAPIIVHKTHNLEFIDIDVISKFPHIYSIGCNSAIQYEKIESVVNTAITSKYVNEDNIYIITNSKRARNWSHHYPLSFVYEELDVEVLSGIMPRIQNQYVSTRPIKKLIIFDNSLTYNFSQKTFFLRFINSCKEYNIAVIVLSSNHELTTSNIVTKFDYIMLYGVTEKWNATTSIDFLRTNSITTITDHRSLMYAMLDCINSKNCLTLRANSDKFYQF